VDNQVRVPPAVLTATADVYRRIRRVQVVTIVWMGVEAAISLFAAWGARSPMLLAFGGDSAIELASAVIVFRRFRSPAASEQVEKRASRLAGLLLFALAACVAIASLMTMLGYTAPKPTFLGIAVLIAATVFMPMVAKEKRRLSALTGSTALMADAAESAICGYLSLVGLLGLLVNAIWHVNWADPAAALLVIPLVLREGWEAMRDRPCACD
jgi:divalent metal cation (Fe/Co/Zn/Cd) transporter